ncbi:MAG: hypothetical protein MUE70_15125 [Desulfobacterales bacterium]|nr:hypothetical protein [Desulfobacterales bacterium]
MIRKAIAGVEMLIEGEDSRQEIKEVGSAFDDFYFQKNAPGPDRRITIQISTSPVPAFEKGSKLFSADGVWSAFKDACFYWIVNHPQSLPAPIWAVRFDLDFSYGTVFCGQNLKRTHNGGMMIYNPVSYPLDQIILMHYLARIGGMIIHSAGWRVNDSGWIFAGKSGAGKSTISNLIVETTGSAFLSDDRIAVRKIGHEYLMYGTPWPGEAGYAVNESVPLKGIFFLSKGEKNSIVKLSPAQAIPRLMPVVSVPWYDREKVDLMMGFFNDLIGALPMYELTFIPDAFVVRHLQDFINDPV